MDDNGPDGEGQGIELTYGRLYEVFPFDNRVARLTVTGEELQRVVEGNLTRAGSRLLMSGIRATASCKGPTLDIRLQRENGAAVKPTDQLRVVTVDFLATGGDGFFDPIQPVKLVGAVTDGPIFRDVMAFNLMKQGGTLKALPPARRPRRSAGRNRLRARAGALALQRHNRSISGG